VVSATDSGCGDGDLGFGRGMGFAEADGAKGNEPQPGGKTSAFGVSLAWETSTTPGAGFDRGWSPRFRGSHRQVAGLGEGVGRDALSGGGTRAYRVSSDAEHVEMG